MMLTRYSWERRYHTAQGKTTQKNPAIVADSVIFDTRPRYLLQNMTVLAATLANAQPIKRCGGRINSLGMVGHVGVHENHVRSRYDPQPVHVGCSEAHFARSRENPHNLLPVQTLHKRVEGGRRNMSSNARCSIRKVAQATTRAAHRYSYEVRNNQARTSSEGRNCEEVDPPCNAHIEAASPVLYTPYPTKRLVCEQRTGRGITCSISATANVPSGLLSSTTTISKSRWLARQTPTQRAAGAC